MAGFGDIKQHYAGRSGWLECGAELQDQAVENLGHGI